MSDRIGDDPILAKPSATGGAVAGVDLTLDPMQNYRFNRGSLLQLLGPLDQYSVADATTLTLTDDHLGATIALLAAGSAIALDAAARGNGFAVEVQNWHSAAISLAGMVSNAALYFQDATHTKISARGSVGLQVITINATRYVRVSGATEA